jgi:hypothetical protein
MRDVLHGPERGAVHLHLRLAGRSRSLARWPSRDSRAMQVAQLLQDYEADDEVNRQLDRM